MKSPLHLGLSHVTLHVTKPLRSIVGNEGGIGVGLYFISGSGKDALHRTPPSELATYQFIGGGNCWITSA